MIGRCTSWSTIEKKFVNGVQQSCYDGENPTINIKEKTREVQVRASWWSRLTLVGHSTTLDLKKFIDKKNILLL